jgi:hypothetical protein
VLRYSQNTATARCPLVVGAPQGTLARTPKRVKRPRLLGPKREQPKTQSTKIFFASRLFFNFFLLIRKRLFEMQE